MEFWEGIILVAGGVFLVGHMAKKKTAVGLVAGSSDGVSNASDLTTYTNQASGYPTIAGEPLEPPQPPVGAPEIPITVSPHPIVTPVRSNPVLAKAPSICPAWGCGARPPVRAFPIGRTTGAPPSIKQPVPVRGTALPAPQTPVAAKTTANPYAKNPIFGPLAQKVIAKSQVAPMAAPAPALRTTFTQAVPVRPMDQHIMTL